MREKLEATKQNQKVFSSFIWAFLERCGAQGVGLLVNIILARLLEPEHYGVLAIMIIFTNLANQLVQNGFQTSLIQNKDVTDEDYSSVLHVSMFATVLLYVALFFSAPAIGRYYEMDTLVRPFRILALIIFPGTLQSVQTAKLKRNMDFKRLFYLSLISSAISGAVGIALALYGYGIWALVGQQIMGAVSICVVMWVALGWRPKATISWTRVKVLFSYGWKLLAASILNTLYNDLAGLVIGKKYKTDTLAYYNKGQEFPQKLIVNINDSIQNVMLPALARVQDDKALCKAMMRRSVTVSCFVIFPLMAGLAAVARPFISVVLTDKWLPAVPFLQLACVSYAFYPIHTANLQAMKAMGRSDMFLKLEIIKKMMGLTVLAITVFCFDSVMAIVWGSTLTIPLGLLINAAPNKKIVGYSFFEQMKDILPALILACGMCAIVLAIELLPIDALSTMVIQVLVGICVYIGGARLFKMESLNYLLTVIKGLKNKKGRRTVS